MPIIVGPLEGAELATATRLVRLLLNDVEVVEADRVFTDLDIADFLTLEGWSVKLAAAQAIDVNATNEALASKVLRTQDVQTDGAKLADAMRKHATALRSQAADEAEEADSGFFFGVVDLLDEGCRPELTQWPYC